MSHTTSPLEEVRRARRLAILTGAGLSAEAGLSTFRGPGGWWQGENPETLATPAAYARDPLRVWRWYRARFEAAHAAQPSAAHRALAALERTREVDLVTQNVDGLHQAAGSRRVIELHGNLRFSRCERCGNLDALEPGFAVPPVCSRCGHRARPNVVWFGEMLPEAALAAAARAFERCEVALVIGTSGLVEPAASLARLARASRARLIEINPEPTPLSSEADLSLRLGASAGLRALGLA